MNKILIGGVVCIVMVLALPLVLNACQKGNEVAPQEQAATTTAPPPSPYVVQQSPPNGAQDVASGTRQLTVTFDVPMAGGFSWTGGGDHFPETTGKPYWSSDRKTCTLPVRLKPNWSYRLGLNSPSHRNFRSADGKQLTPQQWTFQTGS